MLFVRSSYVICPSIVCTPMSLICHSFVLAYYVYVLVCHLYVVCMYSHVICMSLLRSRMYLCFTRMHSYVIRMSLVCTRMSSVCHSYVVLPWLLVNGKTTYEWHTDDIWINTGDIRMTRRVTRLWFYNKPILNLFLNLLT